MAKVMKEVHLTSIKPKNTVLLLAQEISFAKVLACNDKRLRDRGVRRLKKWFLARSQGTLELTKEDLMRIWKGLFYCMWMSDKPLVQEELAEEISSLVHSFATFKASLLFVETFFSSLSVEWFGIDQLRMDKFMMLVRRFLRQSLELVARLKWAESQVQQLVEVYERTVTSAPMGLSMHLIEIFCEELAKVGKGELSSETVLQFIAPFARIMAGLKDGRLISQIMRYVFLHLMRQSELGIEYQMKFSQWKEYGFPGGDVDAAEKIEEEEEPHSDDELIMRDSDEEGEEERQVGVDARAGKVDVMLPPLDFDPHQLLKVLVELRNKKETTTKARKTLIQLISKFENFAAGKYPLGLHKVELAAKEDKKKQINKAAKKLLIDEHQMIYSDNEDAENISTKQKKRKKKDDKIKSEKQSVWEISDSNNNASQNGTKLNSSWDVSETANNDIPKSNNSKKRKIVEDNALTANTPVKKTKVAPCSVSDIKENAFPSPVASTPKNGNKSNVLKKLSSNSHNVTNNELLKSKYGGSDSQQKKRTKQKNKRKSNKNATLDVASGKSIDSKNENLKLVQKESNNESSLISECNKSDNTNDASDIQLNTSTSENNNGWGGEWDEQPKDVEYEIFIPNKKYVEKRKSLGLSYPLPTFFQKAAEKATHVNRLKSKKNKNESSTPGSQKKVEFNLRANCSQDYKDYTQEVKRSKTQVPFNADRKPVQGLLKNSTPSPINPFYLRKLKQNLSPVTNR